MKTEEIKRTSDKKGISLIVLVITIIVIIILAVAVILSIANNNPIENAKEARFKNDIKTIEEDLNMYTLKKYADGKIKGIEEVNLSEDDMVSALPSTKNYKDKVEVKNGTLYIKSGDVLTKDEQEWAKEVGVEKTPITFKKQGTEELAIGSEVTATNGESFYVIGEDKVGTISSSAQNILLLAKYNLKRENNSITLKQDTSGEQNVCRFSDPDNYWADETTYPLNLNDYEISEGVYSIVTTAKEYGKSLGVPGRLMTYEEAKALETDYSDILYGKYTKDGHLVYWLGTVSRLKNQETNISNFIWYVYYLSLADSYFISDFNELNEGETYGVRPVIEVPISLVQ